MKAPKWAEKLNDEDFLKLVRHALFNQKLIK